MKRKQRGHVARGCLLIFKNRYQLGKKATFAEKALIGRKEEAEKFNQISHCTVPKETWTKSVSKITRPLNQERRL